MRRIALLLLRISSRITVYRNKYKIVAITGSVGKTSVKKAITLVLKSKYKVLSFEDEGYNTEVGLPLTLLEKKVPRSQVILFLIILLSPFLALKKRDYDFCILEMGANKPGDIDYFNGFIKPNVSVVTNVYPVHIEEFKSQENIAKEKGKIYNTLGKGDFAITNTDDAYVSAMKIPKEAEGISFGRKSADVTILSQDIRAGQSINKFEILGERAEIKSHAIGESILYTFATAIAAGLSQGVERQDILSSLASFQPVKGRLNLVQGIRGCLIIDDSYNANPESMKNALDVLASIEGKSKIAALGDMNELGEYEAEGHKKIGAYLVGKCDILVTVGGISRKYIGEEAKRQGFEEKNILNFDDATSAGKYLNDTVQKGDVILAKGSQDKVRMEHLVEEIIADKKTAKDILCRQEAVWKKR